MTMSSLANKGLIPASGYSSGRSGQTICKFTPHYMAGNLTLEACVGCWTNREASSNYGIDSEGNIACFVEEENRAWTSSSYENDNQAITVEVANLENETGKITDAAWQALVKLATDVCHRYNFRLEFNGTPSGSLTMHKMFASTACPGAWIESHMNELAQTVNRNLDTGNFSYSGTASVSGTTSTTGSATGGASSTGGLSGSVNITDPAIAYAAGIEGQILFDQEEVYPFIISIDGNTRDDLDFEKLKEFDVVGADIYLGSYYSENYQINENFRNPKLDKQYNAVKDAGLSISISTDIRGRNEQEINDELYEIRLAALRYRPNMGLWLKPHLQAKVKSTSSSSKKSNSDSEEINSNSSKTKKSNLNLTLVEKENEYEEKDKDKNDKLIKIYYDKLIKLGFHDQVGFYCKKDELKKFHWDSVCEDWYWWMDRHIQNVDSIHNMPTPEFFLFNNPKDEDGLLAPDTAGWASAKASGAYLSSGRGTILGAGSGNYTDYQKTVSDAAECGTNCCTTNGLCAQFITDVFKEANKIKSDIKIPYGHAIDYWTKWGSSGGTDKNPPVGAVVVGSGWPYGGSATHNPYGHVGVVLCDGRIADNVGYHRISENLDAWLNGQNAICGQYQGYVGWVWASGQDLSKLGVNLGGNDVSNILNSISDIQGNILSKLPHSDGHKFWIKQSNGRDCGAAAFLSACNILANKIITTNDLEVWYAMQQGSVHVNNIVTYGTKWLYSKGYGGKITVANKDKLISSATDLASELAKGHVLIMTSSNSSTWYNSDGTRQSSNRHRSGHYVCWYFCDGRYFYLNDSSAGRTLGAGAKYTIEQAEAWIKNRGSARSWINIVLSIKG